MYHKNTNILTLTLDFDV